MIRSEPNRSKLLLLLGVVLVAAFLRLHKINDLPPGDGYDPAFYGLDALAILRGDRPVFLTTNFGREPLFSYLVAASFLVLGVGPHAIHVTSAIIGILTVPAIYLVAHEMFSDEDGLLARFGGLVAALTLTVSYWHLNWSRFGVRAILVPLFAALTVFFLWRGFRTGQRRAFVGSGFFLGMGMYTYQAARFLPVLVVLGFVYVARSRPPLSKTHFVNLVVVTVVALLVFAPLGYYFLTHPGSFTHRAEQTLVVDTAQGPIENLRALAGQVIETLLVFSFRGDEEPVHTIPGRPALNPFLSVVFVVGIGISLLRIKRPLYLFLVTWLIVMSAPAILAGRGPTGKRAIGTMPAVVMLIAIGVLASWDLLRGWAARRPSVWPKVLTATVVAVIGLGFVYTGASTYYEYFIVWGQDPDLFTHFEAGLPAIGDYIEQLPPDEQIYLSPVLPEHPSVRLNSGLRDGIKGYNGRVCLVMPERTNHGTTYIIVPHEDTHSIQLLEQYFPQGEIVAEGPLHYQQPYFLAYRVPAGAKVQVEPSRQLRANWSDKIRLVGYDLGTLPYRAGDAINLTLYYQGLAKMETDYTVFTHLVGPHNPANDSPVWGQDDSEPCRRFYPTSTWDAGEIARDQFTISIPVEAPTGDYALEMGFYDWQTLERLPVLDTGGDTAAHSVILTQIHVTGRE